MCLPSAIVSSMGVGYISSYVAKKRLLVGALFIVVLCVALVWYIFAMRLSVQRAAQAKQAFLKRVEESENCVPLKGEGGHSRDLVSLDPELNQNGLYLRGYYKDAHCVYEVYQDEGQDDWWVVRGADVDTIESLGSSYARDAYAVFSGSTHMEVYDPKTFEILPGGLVKDKHGVYLNGTIFPDADPETLMSVGQSYWRDKRHVYFVDATGNDLFLRKIDGADPKTLVVEGESLARDAQHFYFKDTILVGDDSAVLERVRGDEDQNRYRHTSQHVFYNSDMVADADAGTFAYIGGGYAKDAHHVYYLGVVVPDANPVSFSVIDIDDVGKDDTHIYFRGHRLVKSEDDRHNYLFDLEAFDLPTLALFPNGVSLIRDKDGVYIEREGYSGRATGPYVTAVAGKSDQYVRLAVDTDTFEFVGMCQFGMVSGTSFYKDKDHVYVIHEGSLTVQGLSADPSSFVYLGYGTIGKTTNAFFSRDKDRIYRWCGDEVFAPADNYTFVLKRYGIDD